MYFYVTLMTPNINISFSFVFTTILHIVVSD